MKIFYVVFEKFGNTFVVHFSTIEFAEEWVDVNRDSIDNHSIHDVEIDSGVESQIA